MLRLDTEKTDGYPREAYEALIAKLQDRYGRCRRGRAFRLAKGVLSEEVCQRSIQMARSRRIPVLVDPKQRDFSRYRGVTAILSKSLGTFGGNWNFIEEYRSGSDCWTGFGSRLQFRLPHRHHQRQGYRHPEQRVQVDCARDGSLGLRCLWCRRYRHCGPSSWDFTGTRDRDCGSASECRSRHCR